MPPFVSAQARRFFCSCVRINLSTAAAECQVFLTYSDLAKGNAIVLYSQLIVQHLLEALHQLADVMN